MNNDFIATVVATLIGIRTILGYQTQFAQPYEIEFDDPDGESSEDPTCISNLFEKTEEAFAEYILAVKDNAPLFKTEGAKRNVEANLKKLSSKVLRTLKTDQWSKTFDDGKEWEYLLFKRE